MPEDSNSYGESMKNPESEASYQPSQPLQSEQKNFVKRLKLSRKKQKLSQKKLAQKIGVSTVTIQNYENGHYPKGEYLIALSSELGCSLDWLLTGKENTQQPVPSSSEAPNNNYKIDNFSLIPKVRPKLNADRGSLITSDEGFGRYAFKSDWINQKGDPSQMVLLDVFGNSMEPVICDGDTVLLDQGQTEITPGRIYALGVDDNVMVKYIESKPGIMVLRSANSEWENIEIDTSRGLPKSVRILGRVIWWCREAR